MKVAAVAGVLALLGVGVASANQTAHYAGLYVYDDDHGNYLVGEIDRTSNVNNLVQKIDNDA